MFKQYRVALAGVMAAGAVATAALVMNSANAQPAMEGHERKSVFFTPGDMEWRDGPESLPGGVQVMLLVGDHTREGLFAMRLRFPAGYQIAPHFHPADENVTVISGTFNLGMGERFEKTSDAHTLPPGGFASMPAGHRHFAWCDEETVIQLHGLGPWRITYVNPADDPRQ
jgi:quercetin dioxygenase-like cupin family protein